MMASPSAKTCKYISFASHTDYRCKWTLLGSQVNKNWRDSFIPIMSPNHLDLESKLVGQIFKPFAQRRGDIQVYHWVVLLSLGYEAPLPLAW